MANATLNYLRRKLSNSTRTVLILCAVTATAIACGWMETSEESVRFGGYLSETAIARLPPLPTHLDSDDAPQIENDYARRREQADAVDELWDRAAEAQQKGGLREQQKLLREYLNETHTRRELWSFETDLQKRRNSAFDRLDALTALDRKSTNTTIQAYLSARDFYDEEGNSEEISRLLEVANADHNLKDNVAYLKAAELYLRNDFKEAEKAFIALSQRYPRSEKREASMFMAALTVMKTSNLYTPTSGDPDHLDEFRTSKAESSAPLTADAAWHTAFKGFKRITTDYPHGRFHSDAKGWIAYLMLRNNDRAGALIEYYRLLADKGDQKTRREAAFSLTMVRHHATDAEMARVERELENEPEVALTYAYHNIYNYAIDPGPAAPNYDEIRDARGNIDYQSYEYQQLEKEFEREQSLAEQNERTRVVRFSQRLMVRYPNLRIGGRFALRAAQASLELNENKSAVQFVQRALRSRLGAEERAEALWVMANAEQRLKHFDSAQKQLELLIRDYPKSHLVAGARQTLATIAEDEGDIDGALEQYIELDYDLDIAYFVDVLMTPEQLAAFIEKHPDLPSTNEFNYALGLRYLRAKRWDDARAVFARVRTSGNAYEIYRNYGHCPDNNNPGLQCFDPKEPGYDGWADFDGPERQVITAAMLMRDVQTANDLEALEQSVEQAEGDDAKAEALYQLASYQYETSTLLFYNPVAWNGTRYWNLSQLADDGHYRAPNESQILWQHMQEHEGLARAVNIYLDVVSKFPATRAAPDALYSAAVCHERLANFNHYWRGNYSAGVHAGRRMVTYADVKTAYPNYQLPRGTYGWQPSRRTVDGGPGWAAPLKPLPRLTRTERVKVELQRVVDWLHRFWEEKARRWLSAIVTLVLVFVATRIAAGKRKLMRERLACLQTTHPRAVLSDPLITLFGTGPATDGPRERLRQFLKEREDDLWRLASDRNSRPVLIENILSHSVLTGLVITLIWVVHFW